MTRLTRNRLAFLATALILAVALSMIFGYVLSERESWATLLISAVFGFVHTLWAGPYLLFVADRFRHLGFAQALVINTTLMSIGFMVTTTLLYFTFGFPETGPFAFETIIKLWGSGRIWLNISFGFGVSFLVHLIWSLVRLVGPSTLGLFLIGRYARGLSEQRLFLLVDLVDSTRLAEKLGNQKFHQFMRNFFDDIADPIMNHGGTIHRYIGDEALVSWPLGHGKTPECFQAIAAIDEAFARKEAQYRSKYGVAPRTRAGLHAGEVLTSELGRYKREIVFLGDPINTTARIAGACRDLEKTLLFSAKVLSTGAALPDGWSVVTLGPHTLRGREQPIELMTVQR